MDNSCSTQTTVVQLELHAQQLKKNATGAFQALCAPFAVVTLLSNNPNEPPRVIGTTEVVKNTLSPRWTTKFELPYEPGTNTRINVGVWNEDPKPAKNNKPMGSALFEVAEVLDSKGHTKAKKLRQGGTIFCRITPAPDERRLLKLELVGRALKNVEGLFRKSNPFFEVYANVASGGTMTWQAVYRSQPVMHDLNPDWEMVVLELARLAPDGDLDRPVLFEVWDWNKHGKHTPMGKFECSVASLLSSSQQTNKFRLMRNQKDFGTIVVFSAVLESNDETKDQYCFHSITDEAAPPALVLPSAFHCNVPEKDPVLPPPKHAPRVPPMAQQPPIPSQRPSFMEYLAGGLEFDLSIAVDFTGSNGDPRQPGTLHYLYPDGQLNDYEKAIMAIGGMLAQYDTDQKFSVFGFGAKYSGVVQHCFQVGDTPNIDGLGGVLQAYRQVFSSGIVMSGPTVISEVIDYTAALSRKQDDIVQTIGQHAYKVLLILTDGDVTDVEMTKRSICNAGDAPMSIVIVGVGTANFQFMHNFNNVVLRPSSSAEMRDTVQFVAFSQHPHHRQQLTSVILEEISYQVVNYFHSRGIGPMPTVPVGQLSLIPEESTVVSEDFEVALTAADREVTFLCNGAEYRYIDNAKYDNYNGYDSWLATATPPPAFVPLRWFQVRVPHGVVPGNELQATNPVTGQQIIVTIPSGATSGSLLNVEY